LAHLKSNTPDVRSFKLQAREEVIPFVTLIPNHIDQEHFEGVIASALGTTKDAIHFELNRLIEEAEKSHLTTGIKVDVSQHKNTLVHNQTHRKEATLLYLLAVTTIVSQSVRSILEQEINNITNSNIDDLTKEIPTDALTKITFQIEEFLEKNSSLVIYEELVYKLEQLRRLYLDEQLAILRQQLNVNSDISDEVLPKIFQLQKKKQLPAYTIDIFPKL